MKKLSRSYPKEIGIARNVVAKFVTMQSMIKTLHNCMGLLNALSASINVYSGLKSRIGLRNLISDGFSWTLLRCIPGDQKVHSAQRVVALKAECNSKLAVAITIMEECFLPMVDMKTGIDMVPQLMYNWGSQFARLNYNGFYTVVLEKDDIVLSVASIRCNLSLSLSLACCILKLSIVGLIIAVAASFVVKAFKLSKIHGVAVAELPLVATCSKNRRQGLCRRLINSIEEMLKALKVEKLVISAIPTLVETWTVGFGFQTLDEDERRSLRICGGDHENLQYCSGGRTLGTPQYQPQKQPVFEKRDPKPSCRIDATRNIRSGSESVGPNEVLPNQLSKVDDDIVKETRFKDSESVSSGENKKPVGFLDELSEPYSLVQDCVGNLRNPVRTGFSAAG
ncbi:hypothetical protein PHJA_000009200 [Phtheirospermum japonicum]|uniref:Increased DNA methylation 1 C-terminal domain-containing protein n=1 Tax=Phtheirospermum japonicum TaxID=374723 RepID=A0A830AXF4_9LAMI|nr:hypothetical protein PHJA_000009200 [Phtheirospermum japonicum]